ncbi:MAG: HAMP domain-containing histidine kinase, partial [Gemmatimonadetes bacterium]|nr:HAMP domain-containing histidine kinase [Gemmatimonadota bacterium]
MTSTRRSPHLAPGSAVPVMLLLALLGLSAVLAYQAVDAARAEARATERALRGYATVATWELGRRADDALRRRLAASLDGALARHPSTATALSSEGSKATTWCACTEAIAGAFRATGDGDADISTSRPALAARLRDEVRRLAAAGSGADSTRIGVMEMRGGRYLVVSRAIAEGDRRVTSGIVVDPARVAAAAFDEAYRAAPLIPGSVRTAGRPEPVSASVTTADGQLVWRAPRRDDARGDGAWVDAKIGAYPPEPLARGDVAQQMDGLFAGLVSRVSVRPDAVVGAEPEGPRTRLPLLLTVFGVTLALVCVAIVQLRRQQELVRLRDDFVSGVSHELRTPLAQIRLFSDLLDSGRLAGDEQRSRSVRIIAEESRRLSWLVENILHFSRSQRGAGRVHPNPVEAAPLIREIVDAFAPLARAREARF